MTHALWLLSLQGLMGGFDNFWNHEWGARLPRSPTARRELKLHAVRGLIYGQVFLIFAWAEVHGLLAWLLVAVLAVEILITLADFVEEDRSRKLSAQERALHALLTLNYGAILALLAPELLHWAEQPIGIAFVDRGWMSWLLTLYALGSSAFGIREALAAYRLGHEERAETMVATPTNALASHRRSVLVTGGTGFIGRALVRRLLERGDRVYVLTRSQEKTQRLFGQSVLAVTAFDQIPEGTSIDAVVNLAGAPIFGPLWTAKRKAALVRSRLETTRDLVDWLSLRRDRPRVLVTASATGWYGAQESDRALIETESAGQDFPAVLCAAWEAEAERAVELGLRICKLRMGLVLGRKGGFLQPLIGVFSLGLGGRFGTGRQWFPWIHIDDLVEMISRAVSDPTFSGAINAVAPAPVTNGQLTSALARHLHRPAWLHIPSVILRALLGEMSMLLTGGQKVRPFRAEHLGFQYRFRDLDTALSDLLGR